MQQRPVRFLKPDRSLFIRGSMSPNNITPQQLRIFAVLLAKPSKDSLAILEEIAQENHWLYESVQELKQISLEDWQAEHTQMFINGYPETCCPPFESVYLHGIMNSPVCNQIEQIYQSVDLEPVDGVPADYLGMMLECAAYLLEQKNSQSSDIENRDQNFQTLWQEHLAKWVPNFANDLQKNSELRLYQQLGIKLKELF